MSYYDPHIYNYANLNKEDKLHFDLMMINFESIEDAKMDYQPHALSSTLERIYCEVASDIFDDVIYKVRNSLIQFIIACIDSYTNDIKAQNTDDYFYGCTILEGHD